MIWRQAKAILILPCNVLGVIPSLIAYTTRDTRMGRRFRSRAGPRMSVRFPLSLERRAMPSMGC